MNAKTLAHPVYVPNDTVENIYFYIDTFIMRRLAILKPTPWVLVNTMLTETLYSKILGTARKVVWYMAWIQGWAIPVSSSNWWFGAQVSDKNAAAFA